ncbi:hypothetical protein MJO28_011471, partial [Puccinia striiformis f. sp. tritici]
IENGFDEETPIIINFCAERLGLEIFFFFFCRLGDIRLLTLGCAPYTGISLLFEQLATKYKGANLEFYRVNLDDDNTLASEAGVEISDLPTFILYRNCIQVETFKGSLPDRLKKFKTGPQTKAGRLTYASGQRARRHKPKHDLRFFNPENKIPSFLRAYCRSRKLQFPSDLTRGERRGALWKIAMSMSNNKIVVNQYPIFSQEILEPIRKRLESLESNLKTLGIEPLMPHQIDLIFGYVANVSQVTIFFVITYLSLFKKHPKDRLSTELVEEILINSGKIPRTLNPNYEKENEWALHKAIILRFEEIHKNPSGSKYWLSGNSCYNMAWYIAMYRRREIIWNNLLVLRSKIRAIMKVLCLINKMVTHANYQNSQSFLHFWGDKKRVEKLKSIHKSTF